MLKIGSHVSMKGKDMLIGAVQEALSYEATTFMIYTGAPQNTVRKPIDEFRTCEGWALMQENNIHEIVIHAPYIINLANTIKSETYELAVEFLAKEIERSIALKAKTIVLHPGAHVKAGEEAGLKSIVKGLNEVLKQDMNITVSLEAMAGKGSELGRTFEELAYIIEHTTHNDKLRVCFDTCHIHDSGYDIVNDFDGVLNEFDKIIGKERIEVIHINDSKNVRGARKDRHENIGKGHIGFEALNYIVHHPQFENVPKILETPYIEGVAPYKEEIAMFRGSGK
ncbi:MAG: deoxyribonuclease IV [Defluviitaleaceae bacterium]|nr:deoxyribonuclease IV [Defluviitaleaceae bacterium]